VQRKLFLAVSGILSNSAGKYYPIHQGFLQEA